MRRLTFAAACVLIAGCGREENGPKANPAPVTLPSTSATDPLNGQVLYVQHCLLCHQQDGGGVPNMQPPLIGSPVASGDERALIELVLRGIGGQPPALPASGSYNMVMPGVPQLTDQDIADLLTYIRQAYVKAEPVSPESVASVRAGLE